LAKKAAEDRDNEKKAAAVAKAREMRLEHEVRRLELHSEKILSRLNALLLQKDRAQKSGIEISRALQRLPNGENERENRWRVDQYSGGGSSSKVEDLHLLSKSLSVLEGRCAALTDENSCLRFTLKQLQLDLVDVLEASSKSPHARRPHARHHPRWRRLLLGRLSLDLPFTWPAPASKMPCAIRCAGFSTTDQASVTPPLTLPTTKPQTKPRSCGTSLPLRSAPSATKKSPCVLLLQPPAHQSLPANCRPTLRVRPRTP